METRVGRWGNSLALRIPRPLADEAGLQEDAPVRLSVQNGKLVIVPVVRSRYSLEALLAQVTPENRHGEVDTGQAVGGEIW